MGNTSVKVALHAILFAIYPSDLNLNNPLLLEMTFEIIQANPKMVQLLEIRNGCHKKSIPGTQKIAAKAAPNSRINRSLPLNPLVSWYFILRQSSYTSQPSSFAACWSVRLHAYSQLPPQQLRPRAASPKRRGTTKCLSAQQSGWIRIACTPLARP